MSKITVIPDVHGRRFWRPALSLAQSGKVVFLGDYMDPYGDEGITSEDAYEQLEEIIDLKRMYPGNVTLLLGNHDLHYLASSIGGCRYDWRMAYDIKAILWANMELFDIAHSDGRYLFTHAGVLKGWYREHHEIRGNETAESIASILNGQFHNSISRPFLMKTLSAVSPFRGGGALYGSPVWADVDEHNPHAPEFPGIYQIFGHSFMLEPVITPYWAGLDCMQCFALDLETGDIEGR